MTSGLPWNTGGQLRIGHLRALTGRFGLFEHAHQDVPRVSPGYTTDDNARALAVLGDAGLGDTDEAARYLRFVLWARVPGGWHNRMYPDGAWLDRPRLRRRPRAGAVGPRDVDRRRCHRSGG